MNNNPLSIPGSIEGDSEKERERESESDLIFEQEVIYARIEEVTTRT